MLFIDALFSALPASPVARDLVNAADVAFSDGRPVRSLTPTEEDLFQVLVGWGDLVEEDPGTFHQVEGEAPGVAARRLVTVLQAVEYRWAGADLVGQDRATARRLVERLARVLRGRILATPAAAVGGWDEDLYLARHGAGSLVQVVVNEQATLADLAEAAADQARLDKAESRLVDQMERLTVLVGQAAGVPEALHRSSGLARLAGLQAWLDDVVQDAAHTLDLDGQLAVLQVLRVGVWSATSPGRLVRQVEAGTESPAADLDDIRADILASKGTASTVEVSRTSKPAARLAALVRQALGLVEAEDQDGQDRTVALTDRAGRERLPIDGLDEAVQAEAVKARRAILDDQADHLVETVRLDLVRQAVAAGAATVDAIDLDDTVEIDLAACSIGDYEGTGPLFWANAAAALETLAWRLVEGDRGQERVQDALKVEDLEDRCRALADLTGGLATFSAPGGYWIGRVTLDVEGLAELLVRQHRAGRRTTWSSHGQRVALAADLVEELSLAWADLDATGYPVLDDDLLHQAEEQAVLADLETERFPQVEAWSEDLQDALDAAWIDLAPDWKAALASNAAGPDGLDDVYNHGWTGQAAAMVEAMAEGLATEAGALDALDTLDQVEAHGDATDDTRAARAALAVHLAPALQARHTAPLPFPQA